jgi:hypothetical protein
MDWQGESWTNWEGNQQCHAAVCIADDLNDLRLILQQAKSAGRTVRVSNGGLGHAYSGSFSGSPVVSNEGGIIVQIPKLNQGFVHEDGSQRITAQAGMLLGDFVELAARHGLALETAPVPLFIQIGGAVALGCHGCGNHGGTISDLVVGMEILKHDGTLQKITKEENPELLRAAQVNLGALGIMYTVTLQCTGQYKLHAMDEFLPMEATIDGIGDLVMSHDYVELFWIPFTDQVWVKRWNKQAWETPSRHLPGLGNRIQQEISVWLGTRALEFLLKFPRWTPLVMNLLKPTIWTGERTGPPARIFHYQQKFPRKLWDLSYALPVGQDFETFKSAWKLTVSKVSELAKPKLGKSCYSPWPWSYEKDGRFPMNFLLHIRFLNHSDGYLAPAVGEERKFMYEAITYFGSDHQQFFDQIEQRLLQLGGRPHWGKTYSVNLDFRKIWGDYMDQFEAIRRQMDPEGLFLNPFLRRVFGGR